MANPFDQFDEAPTGGNPFDQFDESPATPKRNVPTDFNFGGVSLKNKPRSTLDFGTPRQKEEAQRVKPGVKALFRTGIEGTGAAIGAAAGGGLASIPLAGAGYAGGKRVADALLGDESDNTLGGIAKDVAIGGAFQGVVPTLSLAAKGVGKVAKPLMGKLSGVGSGAIEEALQSGAKSGLRSTNPLASSNAFDDALRGNVSADDVVDTARTALSSIKNSRAAAYQSKLSEIDAIQTPIDTRPIKTAVGSLMRNYNVKVLPNGTLDTSRIAMGKTGRNDIKEIIETVSAWGTKPGDNTAVGLDTLKRQMDDFYSDSSQARQFVAAIRDQVHKTISNSVPQYAEMTKGYTDATRLIKDIESGLMMRKSGMSGRITADQTLRRLTSAMRDNFEMRKDLVEALGTQGGQDLNALIAGYTMNTPIPRGLAGTGPSLAGQAYISYLNPNFLAVLAASSPRLQGEFLRLFGRGLGELNKLDPKSTAKLVRNLGIMGMNANRYQRGNE